MAKYLLSVVYPAGRTQPEPGQLARITADVTELHEEMSTAGIWVFGGGLASASSAERAFLASRRDDARSVERDAGFDNQASPIDAGLSFCDDVPTEETGCPR